MALNTRTKLLEVTRELVDAKGVEFVSMREVGRLAGLSRSAIYRHFDSKQSLLAAIVVEDFNLFFSGFNEIKADQKKPTQYLIDLLAFYLRFALKHSEHYQLMFQTKWDSTKYPAIKEAADLVFQFAQNVVSETQKVVNSTKLKSIKTTAIIFSFIHGLVELHLADHAEKEKGLDKPEELIEQFIETLF